jgi:hypothetical protein
MRSAEIFFQETHAEYHTLAAHQDEYCPEEPRGTKEFGVQERAAEKSATPPRDLATTKEVPESLKMKLPDGNVFNMSIFSQGNTKEYLAHVIPVLHLINQKRLDKQCRELAKAIDKLARTLEKLLEAVGTKSVIPKDEMESHKLEIRQTQAMLQEAQKTHTKAIAKTYKLLRIFLSGDTQYQWDCVCREMHERDLWAGVNGQVTKGRHP